MREYPCPTCGHDLGPKIRAEGQDPDTIEDGGFSTYCDSCGKIVKYSIHNSS